MSITIANQKIQEDHSVLQKSQTLQSGLLRSRVVTFVALGTTTVLCLTATVVAAVFASYLLAAICVSAALISIAATILVGRIKTTQPPTTQFSTPRPPEVNIQNEAEPNFAKEKLDTENLELKKQISDLKAELEAKAKEILVEPQSDELLQKQTKIEEQEQEINHLKDENQKLLNELEELKIQQKTDEEDLEDKSTTESFKSEEHASDQESSGETQSSVSTEVSKEENSQQDKESNFRKLKERLFKSNKKEMELNLTPKEQEYLTHDLIPNNISKQKDIIDYFTVMKEIEAIEKQEDYDGSFEILKDNEKKIRDILLEIKQTETQFSEGIQILNKFLLKALEKKALQKKEFTEITENLNSLINESQLFLRNLPAPQLSIEDSVQMYYKATIPANIQKYYEAFLATVPKYNFIRESLNKLSEKSKGRKLVDEFNERKDGLCIFDFSIKIVQRFPKHILMIKDLIKSSNLTNPIQQEAFERNLSYMGSTLKRMNILTPRFDPSAASKKRVSGGSQNSEK